MAPTNSRFERAADISSVFDVGLVRDNNHSDAHKGEHPSIKLLKELTVSCEGVVPRS